MKIHNFGNDYAQRVDFDKPIADVHDQTKAGAEGVADGAETKVEAPEETETAKETKTEGRKKHNK